MKKIKVSFVIAVLNGISTIEECINSIMSQKYPSDKYEVLVIDGGSTDGTVATVKSLQKKHTQIKIMKNPFKLSEGEGNGKDQGVSAAKGEYIIFLDHDNILLHDDWLTQMLSPLEEDKNIMASQSFLMYKQEDSPFLKYVNALGVEDPFAVEYSLVSQAVLHPEKFDSTKDYYLHTLNPKHVLFGGANGCIFRKEVFKIIGNYTRDVDVFQDMAKMEMKVAIPKESMLYHKTSNSLSSFMIKKGKYYYRFIKNDYTWKKYNWAGNDFRSKIRFWLRIASNLSFLIPAITAIKQFSKKGELFWLLHPFYTFFITLEYGLITLFFMRNYLNYLGRR